MFLPECQDSFWWVPFGKCEKKDMEKSAIFLGGYGQIGEIPHGNYGRIVVAHTEDARPSRFHRIGIFLQVNKSQYTPNNYRPLMVNLSLLNPIMDHEQRCFCQNALPYTSDYAAGQGLYAVSL